MGDEVDISDLLCGKKLEKLRKRVKREMLANGAIFGLPLTVFTLLTLGQMDHEMLDTWWVPNALDDGRIRFFLKQTWQFLVVPILKIPAVPLDRLLAIASGPRVFGLYPYAGALSVLICVSAAAVGSYFYMDYFYNNMHFRYVLTDENSRKCVSEDLPSNSDADPRNLECNPGLSRSKQGHLRAVLGMLKSFVQNKGCRTGQASVTSLEDARAHVTIAAARVQNRANAWSRIYFVIAIAVAAVVLVMLLSGTHACGRFLLEANVYAGTRAIRIAFLSFALAMIIVTSASVTVAIEHHSKLAHQTGEGFLRIHRALNGADCNEAGDAGSPCREAVREALGEAELVRGRDIFEGRDTRYSPRILAAVVIVGAIVLVAVVVHGMGGVNTTKGIRALQSSTMRGYAGSHDAFRAATSGMRRAVVGGATGMNASDFDAKLDRVQALIGERVPLAHVMGWATALTVACVSIAVRGGIELFDTTRRIVDATNW